MAGRGLEQPDVYAHAIEILRWREVHRGEWCRTARFQVYGLPDTACFAIPLLTLELEGVLRVVDADDEALRHSRACQCGELERKRRVSALMLAEPTPVEPRGG